MLAQYVPAFDSRFLGLYTDLAGTEALAKKFKVFYQKSGDISGPNYTVDHSAGTYVHDPSGRLRLYVKHGEPADKVAADIRRLLAESPEAPAQACCRISFRFSTSARHCSSVPMVIRRN